MNLLSPKCVWGEERSHKQSQKTPPKKHMITASISKPLNNSTFLELTNQPLPNPLF